MRNLWLIAILGSLIILLPVLSFNNKKIDPVAAPDTTSIIYPKNYFISPIKEEIKVSGTFGELRPDHFHSGLDIKSNTGRVGQAVYAAAAGFIDRIKVMPGSYGHALYLKHPNGYMTLYGHLDQFAPEIDQYVKDLQYKRHRFEVDIHPPDGLFKVKQGQEIAKMGNSGASSGPHLHFEIRHTATQKVINPLLCGIPVKDNVPPEIREMKVYFLDEQRGVLGSKPFPVRRQKNGAYLLEGDTVRIGAWRIGFGVKTFDGTTVFHNDNGIYNLALYANEHLAYEWKMNEMEFEEARFLNAHIDFEAKERFGAWFHRCFVLPGDRLSNYTPTEALGLIPIFSDKPVKITLKATDAAGNESVIHFWVLRDANHMETFPPFQYQYDLPYDTDSKIDLTDFSMVMPKGALYQNLHFQYFTTPDDSKEAYSSVYHLEDRLTPVHRYFSIRIRPNKTIPAELYSKMVIAKCGEGRPENCGLTWDGAFATTKIREFGDYCLLLDTVPPSIIPVIFDKDMRKKSNISFRIVDNYDTGGQADGLSYSGTVDGNWVLFEYDRKKQRLTYTFDEHVGPGQHQLKLTVKDDRNNIAVFERPFLR
jgi:hypothetical protein